MPKNGRLSDEIVIEILTSKESSPQIEKRLGVSQSNVRLIRKGTYYAHVAPEIPRWTRQRRRLTESQVLEILTSGEISAAVARKYNVSANFIRKIRKGQLYADMHKEVQRGYISTQVTRRVRTPIIDAPKGKAGKTCQSCIYYSQEYPVEGHGRPVHCCDFEFPEIRQRGLGINFARECLQYKPTRPETLAPVK